MQSQNRKKAPNLSELVGPDEELVAYEERGEPAVAVGPTERVEERSDERLDQTLVVLHQILQLLQPPGVHLLRVVVEPLHHRTDAALHLALRRKRRLLAGSRHSSRPSLALPYFHLYNAAFASRGVLLTHTPDDNAGNERSKINFLRNYEIVL